MTQAVYEKDLRKLGYRSGYEDAKLEYDSLLRKSEARYQKREAKRIDKITQLESALAYNNASD